MILFLMWLPVMIPKSLMVRAAKFIARICAAVAPYIARAWAFICDISPRAAERAERVPYIGQHLAWILNLPPRLKWSTFIELILGLCKKGLNP